MACIGLVSGSLIGATCQSVSVFSVLFSVSVFQVPRASSLFQAAASVFVIQVARASSLFQVAASVSFFQVARDEVEVSS